MATLQDLMPKHLYTQRLTLEFFTSQPEEWSLLLSTVNNKTAMTRMGIPSPRTQAQFESSIKLAYIQDPRLKDGVADAPCMYIIRDRSTSERMGILTFCQRRAMSQGKKIVLPGDIGWALTEEFMGEGYATEAASEFLRFLREEWGAKEVVVFKSPTNEQSNRVAEKLGFVDGGECPDLDSPGKMVSIYILPGMERIDESLKEGLKLRAE